MELIAIELIAIAIEFNPLTYFMGIFHGFHFLPSLFPFPYLLRGCG